LANATNNFFATANKRCFAAVALAKVKALILIVDATVISRQTSLSWDKWWWRMQHNVIGTLEMLRCRDPHKAPIPM